MLKIRDDVDLKELEKFGLKNHKAFYYKKLYNDEDTSIGLHVDTGKYVSIDFYNVGYTGILYNLDVLYDLIQANLVEKVSD